jgi:DNA-binding transcriptional LysR family regulator
MFYQTCIDLLRSLDSARRRLERFTGSVSGDIKIGITPTVARSVLSPALGRFVLNYPNANVKVVEGYSANIIEEVKAGTIDFGVVPSLPNDSGLRGRVFGKSAEVFVTAPTGPQPDREPIVLRDQPPLKLVLPSLARARRAHLDRFLAATEARIERIIDMDSMFATLDFVATTDWVTILPSIMLRDLDSYRFKINPFAGEVLYLDIVVIESLRRPLSTISTALVESIEEEAEATIREVDRKLLPGATAEPPA